jgi:hypothetical protein
MQVLPAAGEIRLTKSNTFSFPVAIHRPSSSDGSIALQAMTTLAIRRSPWFASARVRGRNRGG